MFRLIVQFACLAAATATGCLGSDPRVTAQRGVETDDSTESTVLTNSARQDPSEAAEPLVVQAAPIASVATTLDAARDMARL